MWTSISELSHPFLQDNHQALKINQPELASRIVAHRDRSDIFVQGDLSKWYACKYAGPSGEFLVHGRHPLEEEIVRFASPVQKAFSEGAWLVILMGSGMGIVLPTIAAYLEKHHRGEPKGVLGLEQDPGLLCAGMCLYDFQAVLKSGRILFAVGPNLADSLHTICERHHPETLEPEQMKIFTGYRVDDRERAADYEHAMREFRKIHEEKRKLYFDLLRSAEQYWSTFSGNIRKVWTHVNDDRGDSRILLGLAEGFREIELESNILHFRDRLFTRFYRCAHDFFSFQPDLILCINHSSNYVASFTEPVPIPRLIWYVDRPENTVEVPYHAHDYAVCVSESFIPEIERRGGRAIGVVPAASAGEFEKPPFHPTWKHDVAYVGSVVDHTTIFQSMDSKCRSWIEQVVETQILQPLKSPTEISAEISLESASKEKLIRLLEQHIPKSRFMSGDRLIEYFIYAEANTRRRVRMISALQNYKKLGIYGPADWARLLPNSTLCRCYLGPIQSAKELGELYRSCKVNLSINSLQGFGFVNVRLFEVPTAGGFLVAEWVPGLENYFEHEKEMFWFSTQEEMPVVIDEALVDEGVRLATISRAQERIRKSHLYQHRAQMILDYLTQR
ncbi:MAG: glycosyltransferase family 1 protein [Candidatus Omnitrophota bacterium]|jgi:hypothetical protein|nr:MAG: glycosyltransferase family 1 protein [Candidatus Omnitrophota bacterium]